jgi:hypothetical protein
VPRSYSVEPDHARCDPPSGHQIVGPADTPSRAHVSPERILGGHTRLRPRRLRYCDKFPVGLAAQTGSHLALCSFTTYANARAYAIAAARHLHLDIEDSTTDHHTRVTPAAAERALRERLIGFGQVLVAQPVGARSTRSNPASTR